MNLVVHIINTRIKCKGGETKLRIKNLLVRRPVILNKLLSLVSFCSHSPVSREKSKGIEYALKRRRVKDLVIITSIKYKTKTCRK